MKILPKKSALMQKGFSLVELMVGLVIGLIATLIISQTMGVFEGQKRATTGTADAQTNGGIALFSIKREMQMAGYPLMPAGEHSLADSAIECSTVNFHASGVTSINPISITDGVATASQPDSDTIIIRYGDSPFGGAIATLNTAGTAAKLSSNLGCQVEPAATTIDTAYEKYNVVIANDGSTCDLTKLSAVSVANTTDVTLAESISTGGANFACLGTWNIVTYAINNGNLERNGTPVVSDVVNLQAQYGISATVESNQIIQWVNASGGWAAPSVANRNLIKAVRIAVVARNPKLESSSVTAACLQAAPATGLCAWDDVVAGAVASSGVSVDSPAPVIDLSPGNADWNRYRYRVFETIIPLRNMVWAKETL